MLVYQRVYVIVLIPNDQRYVYLFDPNEQSVNWPGQTATATGRRRCRRVWPASVVTQMRPLRSSLPGNATRHQIGEVGVGSFNIINIYDKVCIYNIILYILFYNIYIYNKMYIYIYNIILLYIVLYYIDYIIYLIYLVYLVYLIYLIYLIYLLYLLYYIILYCIVLYYILYILYYIVSYILHCIILYYIIFYYIILYYIYICV